MSKQKQKSPKLVLKIKNQKNNIQAQLQALPVAPGIYQMRNSNAVIIYIGKAKSIKARVSSYFKSKDHTIKTQKMVKQVASIDYIVTHSENEALILERQLIRQYQPKYNILLKDDKSFPYIKVTNEVFPKVKIVRMKKNDGATYFGPYPSLGSTRKMEQLLTDLFLLRTCKQKITADQLQPKCILLDMEKCLGPCVNKTVKKEYEEQLEWLRLLLMGQQKNVQKELIKQMKAHSEAQQYEQAANYRDMITKITQLSERQTVDINQKHAIQVWVFMESDTHYYILVQEIIQGQLLRQNGYQHIKVTGLSQSEIVSQAIESDQDIQLESPQELIMSAEALQPFLKMIQQYFPAAKITTPQRGVKLKVLERATSNALFAMKRIKVADTQQTPQAGILESLKQQLNLSKVPYRIWGFDISHLDGTNIVASAVCFTDEQPDKAQYRRFNIRSITGKSDDVRAMKEVVSRRLQQAIGDQDPFPNLILIDGGKGQLNFAYQALVELGVVPIIEILALAKKAEEIFMINQKKSIKLTSSNAGLQLLQRIRDEAHRFAVTFQRQKRSKQIFNNNQ